MQLVCLMIIVMIIVMILAIIIIAIISNAASQTGSALAKGFYVRSDRSVLAQARRGGEPHLGEWRPRAVLLEGMDQSGLTAA